MLREKIIRAWKDPEFRNSLSEEESAELPEHPAGAIELTDEELDFASGGHIPSWYHPSQSNSARPSSYSSSRPSRRPSSYSSRPSNSSNSASYSSRSYSNSNSTSYRYRRPFSSTSYRR